jgi:hypothetical protein
MPIFYMFIYIYICTIYEVYIFLYNNCFFVNGFITVLLVRTNIFKDMTPCSLGRLLLFRRKVLFSLSGGKIIFNHKTQEDKQSFSNFLSSCILLVVVCLALCSTL